MFSPHISLPPPHQAAMNNRPPARRVGQNQFTVKRHKVAHPMERVLDDIRRQGFDRQRSEDRHRRYQELQQFQQQPGDARKVGWMRRAAPHRDVMHNAITFRSRKMRSCWNALSSKLNALSIGHGVQTL